MHLQEDKYYIDTVKRQIEEDKLRNHYLKMNQIASEQEQINDRMQQKRV